MKDKYLYYNKGENLSVCPICEKHFNEGDPVDIIEMPKGPFLIIHRDCYKKLCPYKDIDKLSKDDSKQNVELDDQAKLWRYMDLAKFVSLLMSEAIYFTAPKCFEDIYEGAHGELRNKEDWDNYHMSYARAVIITAPDNCWHKIDPIQLEDNAQSLTEQLSNIKREDAFISCWHHNEVESEAMWKLYSKNVENAIAIQTTYGVLKEQLGEDVTIRPIKYIDYSKGFVGSNDVYWYKRKSFAHENEVRAIVYEPNSYGELGILKSVDLTKLIKSIYISPYAPRWFYEMIADLIKRYGYEFEVKISGMKEQPF